MAKFKCKNCGNVFTIFCDGPQDASNVMCPSCNSHWVELMGEDKGFNFPVLPYTDPIYPPTFPMIDKYKFWRNHTLHAPAVTFGW